jgi:hypothetical protein
VAAPIHPLRSMLVIGSWPFVQASARIYCNVKVIKAFQRGSSSGPSQHRWSPLTDIATRAAPENERKSEVRRWRDEVEQDFGDLIPNLT